MKNEIVATSTLAWEFSVSREEEYHGTAYGRTLRPDEVAAAIGAIFPAWICATLPAPLLPPRGE